MRNDDLDRDEGNPQSSNHKPNSALFASPRHEAYINHIGQLFVQPFLNIRCNNLSGAKVQQNAAVWFSIDRRMLL